MEIDLKIQPATLRGALELAPRLRASDVEEIRAGSGSDPESALIRAVQVSPEALEVRIDGEVVCMFGVGAVNLAGGVGSPWMLGSDELSNYPKLLLEISSRWIADVRGRYRFLANWVDSRNPKSVTWLRWLGFHVFPARPYGPEGLPFHRFTMGCENV